MRTDVDEVMELAEPRGAPYPQVWMVRLFLSHNRSVPLFAFMGPYMCHFLFLL